MSAPGQQLPGGNSFPVLRYLAPQSLSELLALHPTLSERTVAHAHHIASRLLQDITTVPELEGCGIQLFRRPGPDPKQELSGGFGFTFGDTCEAPEGFPDIDAFPTVARIHVYRVIPGDIGRVYEMEEFTADEGDEVARTLDGLATLCRRQGLVVAPDLAGLADYQPDQIIIDTVDFGRQRL